MLFSPPSLLIVVIVADAPRVIVAVVVVVGSLPIIGERGEKKREGRRGES